MLWIALLASAGLAGAGAGRLGRWALERALPPAPVPRGWCEIGAAVLWAGVLGWYAVTGQWPGWWLPVPLVLAGFGVPLAVVDLCHRRLPDTLTLPAYPALALALAVAAVGAPAPDFGVRAACAGLVFGGLHALIRWWTPHALGAGDVKLAGSLGAVLGAISWAALPVAACLAAISSALLAAGAALRRRRVWRDGVPHGPGLLGATLLVTLMAVGG